MTGCWDRKRKCCYNRVRLIRAAPLYSYRSVRLVRGLCSGLGHRQGCVHGQSVCVFACVTCRLWVRWVVVWGTNWNERRCASLSQHGQSICQGDITALTPHPSPPGATEPCSSWWLISIPPSQHYTPTLVPHHPCTHTPLLLLLLLLYTCTPTNKQILTHTLLEALLFTSAHSGCTLTHTHYHLLSHTHMAGAQGPNQSHTHKPANCSKHNLSLLFGGIGWILLFVVLLSGSNFHWILVQILKNNIPKKLGHCVKQEQHRMPTFAHPFFHG